jgi:hypothetical protein
MLDIAIHMGLEAIGGGVAYYAYGFCHHWRHRLAVWFALSLLFSIVTVQIVG